jgi:hypothetical protein
MDNHLKGDAEKSAYLDLVDDSNAGVWFVNKDGTPKEDHNYWEGIADSTAKGIKYEVKGAVK